MLGATHAGTFQPVPEIIHVEGESSWHGYLLLDMNHANL